MPNNDLRQKLPTSLNPHKSRILTHQLSQQKKIQVPPQNNAHCDQLQPLFLLLRLLSRLFERHRLRGSHVKVQNRHEST